MSAAVKRAVDGSLVKLLVETREDRGMELLPFATRCLRRWEIHELVTTDQVDAVAGDRIDRVGFLGFAEIRAGGVVERGDALIADGRRIGTVLGFDDCHFPNHLNIIVATPRLETATTAGLALGSAVRFQPA